MSTEIKSLITVCLPFKKVKIDGEWYAMTDAVVNEVTEMRKMPMVWVYIKNGRCADCTMAHECVNLKDN